MKWFERKFPFEHLEGSFPGILERLQGTSIRLNHKIRLIPETQYQICLDNSWSIQQHVGHLGDLENLWESRFVDFIKGREVLTEADLTNEKTHTANHNESSMEQLLNDFESQRSHLCRFLKSITHKAEVWYSKHPRLMTPMRPIDLAYFVAEHDDHHLARISELHEILEL